MKEEVKGPIEENLDDPWMKAKTDIYHLETKLNCTTTTSRQTYNICHTLFVEDQ